MQELILFSRADLERSIPSMVDGLKPGQRKILFCCFKRNIRKDVKAGSPCCIRSECAQLSICGLSIAQACPLTVCMHPAIL